MSSPSAERALRSLGSNLKVARLKRRISVKDFAERLGVSERTVARLEKGDGGVRIETLAMACLVLGELDRISNFLDMGSDDIGLLLEKQRLPKRIRSKGSKAIPRSLRRRNSRKRKFDIAAPLADRLRRILAYIQRNRSVKGADESGFAAVNSYGAGS